MLADRPIAQESSVAAIVGHLGRGKINSRPGSGLLKQIKSLRTEESHDVAGLKLNLSVFKESKKSV